MVRISSVWATPPTPQSGDATVDRHVDLEARRSLRRDDDRDTADAAVAVAVVNHELRTVRAGRETSVPFAVVGAIQTLWFVHFNTSIAVWIGMIALLGVASETASVMVVYLDEAWNERRANGRIKSVSDVVTESLEAGAKRVRPMLMTVMTNVLGLLPILLDTGVVSDVAKSIAAPMWGGLVSLTTLTLLVIPPVYVVWRSFHLRRAQPSLPSARSIPECTCTRIWSSPRW